MHGVRPEAAIVALASAVLRALRTARAWEDPPQQKLGRGPLRLRYVDREEISRAFPLAPDVVTRQAVEEAAAASSTFALLWLRMRMHYVMHTYCT